MRWMVLVVAFWIAFPSFARMYHWTDPDTGTSYMSGVPPAWYRTVDGGPRVLVYEKGKLMDDTEWQATKERGKVLREKALKEAEERKLAEEQLRQEAQQAALEREAKEQVDVESDEMAEPDKAKLQELVRKGLHLLLTGAGAEKSPGGE